MRNHLPALSLLVAVSMTIPPAPLAAQAPARRIIEVVGVTSGTMRSITFGSRDLTGQNDMNERIELTVTCR